MFRTLSRTNGTETPGGGDLPVIVEEEPGPGGIAMVFTALCGVVAFGYEPAASSLLLMATLGLAVYTTAQPDARAWELYHAALRSPLEGRLGLLEEAAEIAPANLQVAFALGLTLVSAGRYAEAVGALRTLNERCPEHGPVEDALHEASRLLLAQVAQQRRGAA